MLLAFPSCLNYIPAHHSKLLNLITLLCRAPLICEVKHQQRQSFRSDALVKIRIAHYFKNVVKTDTFSSSIVYS